MLPIPVVDGVSMVFGCDALKIMPAEKDIPADYPNRQKWEKLTSTWFFRGLKKGAEFIPKPGVDKAKAIAAIRCVLGSFEPSHEHKGTAVSFMLSEWFEDVKYEAADPAQ